MVRELLVGGVRVWVVRPLDCIDWMLRLTFEPKCCRARAFKVEAYQRLGVDEVSPRHGRVESASLVTRRWDRSVYPYGRVRVGYRVFQMVLVTKQKNSDDEPSHDRDLRGKRSAT